MAMRQAAPMDSRVHCNVSPAGSSRKIDSRVFGGISGGILTRRSQYCFSRTRSRSLSSVPSMNAVKNSFVSRCRSNISSGDDAKPRRRGLRCCVPRPARAAAIWPTPWMALSYLCVGRWNTTSH
eukprot:scaffold104181_cov28-Tisochrysis_lutea.AAC.1